LPNDVNQALGSESAARGPSYSPAKGVTHMTFSRRTLWIAGAVLALAVLVVLIVVYSGGGGGGAGGGY
jgi:hypothetical protein